MLFTASCIESFGYAVPTKIISTQEIEHALQPLYERLRLPEGRLELMTGIRERRVWAPGTLPSDISIQSGNQAIEVADFDRSKIGALIHASVCRDHLEPATACRVHHDLKLSQECVIYDVSNACLGILNGVIQIANMIQLGQIEAGLVVGTEDSRHLLETTIAQLNSDPTLTRNSVKPAMASLTIGSASCAVLVSSQEISKSGNALVGANVRANTVHHGLCHSGRDEAVAAGMSPLMQTDSEKLMREGIQTGIETFRGFLTETGWNSQSIAKTVCHQVGSAHRKLMLESLELSLENDFTTMEWLGNTGSVALPITAAIAAEQEFFNASDPVAFLGIGSGINCVMLAIDWNRAMVAGIGPMPISDVIVNSHTQ